MVSPHHFAHWYPTAAYLYVLGLDTLALAWEYLRRHPDYRLDWLRRARRSDAGHRWGLRLLEDPALDARDAHPAWLPGHTGVVQLYPDADPPPDAAAFDFWNIPGHKQLLHDGKRLALIARSPGQCLRFALAPGLEDGMAVAYARRGGAAAPAPRPARAIARSRPSWTHWPWPRLPRLRRRPVPGPRRPRCWNCTPCRRSTRPWRARHCAKWPKGCSAPMPSPPTGTRTAPYVPACGGWYVVAMR